ncbi:aromatic ring-hydroxylating oxygenase subunit alpha [Paenibacillus whitsoniae]|uniref:Aromatic ring-hydroxylating dioxygenase subunit alpha n=1 Tax=Paenibacillus whitsoniae TaxID=2496558 RepID=A0A3S0CUP4_9BACL|nr:aromatic ring-hydroxylating dioxygenase subunit alpha [Paenibacillus whitsoniae]RTE09141.1 aromatic ring-hydroxylating dioxygenase subunit alpha [Paenibacillus whitsoniae]
MKPATVIDEVLANEWFAVLKSEELEASPKQVLIMGQRVVVFRTRKGVHAFKDLCIHRGSALSIGTVENDTIVCPYHGWQYDGEGHCVCIPAQSRSAAIPTKAKATVYHSEEKYGLIWVCLGTPSAPIPDLEPYRDPAFSTYTFGPYRVESSAARVIENFLDFSHLMWVHQGYLSDRAFSEMANYQVHRKEGRLVTDEVIVHEYNLEASHREFIPVTYVKEAYRPLTAFLTKTFGTGRIMCILMVSCPIDAHTSVTYTVHAINFDPGKLADYIAMNDAVMMQDVQILENQKPEELPLDLQAELSLKSDLLSIAYRKWLAELGVKMGTA